MADIDVPACGSNYERNRCPARRWIYLLIGLPVWLFFPVSIIASETTPVAEDTTSTPVIFAIIVAGNRLTTEAFILREMRLKPGMLADARRLDADRAHLMSLGLFNRVELKVASDQGRAVVQVEVSESLHLYPFFILNWDPDKPSRRTYGLTLYHNNFRGLGARLGGAVWQGSSRGFTLFHQDPWFSFGRFGLDAQILYNTGEIRNAADSLLQRDLFALSAVFRQRLGLQNWLDIGANWQTVDASLDSYTLTAGNRDRVFSLNSALSADHRDYCYYPTRGILFRVAAEANLVVDEPHYFYRESLEFRRYRSFRSIIVAWRVVGRFAQQPLPENYNLAVNSELIRAGESYETGRGGLAATNLELRFNLRRMRYYSFPRAPLLGKYLENLKFSVEGVVFGDAGMAFEYRGSVTKEFRAAGGGLQFQVPFLETVHLLAGWTPQDRLTEPWILVGAGVTY